jgi:nucleoid-associated protein YgaU
VFLEHMYAMAAPLRQTRRARRQRSPWPGRLRRSALLAGAVLALSLGLATVAEGGASPGGGANQAVTVQPGDTLWAIASNRYPGSDVRAKVWQIEQANHLAGKTLQPGETIEVPSR